MELYKVVGYHKTIMSWSHVMKARIPTFAEAARLRDFYEREGDGSTNFMVLHDNSSDGSFDVVGNAPPNRVLP